ncbi:MAG TPA: hypothetical protein PLA94_12495, partial [Myxococcota bacterium]|nr:hypothetical protein [Myxococcota bacterium]
MILWSLVGSLALAADPPVEAQEEAASSWWNRILSAWVQAEGLQSYQIQVELSFKENRRVEAVKIMQSSASAEQNERLVARLLAAAPAPKGTPAVAGFGGGAAVGGQDGIPKASVVELTVQPPPESPANTSVNRDSEVFGTANTSTTSDENAPEMANTQTSRDSEVFGNANEPVNRDSEMFGTPNEAANRDNE